MEKMGITPNLRGFILATALLFIAGNGFCCSMYKITFAGKTIVGTNFDAYYSTPAIWFENATDKYLYGAGFSGGRLDGANGIAPQSGMNEAGLSFSRLASPTPETGITDLSAKKRITNPTLYLKEILHHCKNVAEVKAYISQYDHSYFQQDVFIYIEKSGKYLIVEPFTMTTGDDAKYVLSNFCPSATSPEYAHKLVRYHNGVEFLKNKIDSTLAFATALSDTMHVCRKKLGDGTLLSSVWDLKQGLISLYFYHDYQHLVQFDLQEELKKGDHFLKIPALFPKNEEFEKLVHYQMPQNNLWIGGAFIFCLGLFSFSGVFFLWNYFRKKKNMAYNYSQLIISMLSGILFYYLFTLLTHNTILYSAAPYKDYKFSMLDIAAYIPIVTLPVFIFLLAISRKIIRDSSWTLFSRLLLTANSLAYLGLTGLFSYWELYSVF